MMSGGKKRSGFQITSVTLDFHQPAVQSASSRPSTVQSASSRPSTVQSASSRPSTVQSASSRPGSSSTPSTPSPGRRQLSQHAAGQGGACRFRVVRLGGGASGGRGLTYRRGRWTCCDVTEGAGLRRVTDSLRHAHSLESLHTIGRDGDSQPIRGRQGAGPALLPPLRLDVDAAGRSVLRLSHSQPSSPPGSYHVTPPHSPDRTMFTLPGDDRSLSLRPLGPRGAGPPTSDVTPAPPPRRQPITAAGGRGSEATMMSLLLFCHSSSSNSQINIDNKIEQAMDLVKSHLLLAVREEVELLKEKIKDLQEKNLQLERENHLLRTHTHT